MEERWLPQDTALSTSGRRLLLRSSGHLVVIFDKCLSLISLAVPSLPVRNNSRRERFISAHSLEDLSPSRQGRHGGAAQTLVVGIGDGGCPHGSEPGTKTAP